MLAFHTTMEYDEDIVTSGPMTSRRHDSCRWRNDRCDVRRLTYAYDVVRCTSGTPIGVNFDDVYDGALDFLE